MKKHLILTLLLSCGALFWSGTAYASPEPQGTVASQATVTVSGTVVDADGEPVIGASVLEKGTKRGIATDINGAYSLKVAPGATLTVSYVGYKTAEVKAKNGQKIMLVADANVLDEVVAVGYGTQKRVNLTGAVSTVDVNKSLESKSETDVMKALQGNVPGLTILNSNGDINASADVVIRGIGTLSNSGDRKSVVRERV